MVEWQKFEKMLRVMINKFGIVYNSMHNCALMVVESQHRGIGEVHEISVGKIGSFHWCQWSESKKPHGSSKPRKWKIMNWHGSAMEEGWIDWKDINKHTYWYDEKWLGCNEDVGHLTLISTGLSYYRERKF